MGRTVKYAMTGRYGFDMEAFLADLEKKRKRHRMSRHRLAKRAGLEPGHVAQLYTGRIQKPSAFVILRLAYFMGNTDVGKYIYERKPEDIKWTA